MTLYRLDFLAISLLSGLVFTLWSRIKSRHRNTQIHPLPPGPKGLPVIGNVLDMPKDKEWLTFADWGKKYGDIIYVENFGSPLILLDSYEAAFDLMERRSSIYSDRPRFPMVTEVMGWDWVVTFKTYGPTFRKLRQFMHRFFQPVMAKKYQDLQMRETHLLLANLLESPDDFVYHIRRTAGAIIMMIVYGHEGDSIAPEGDVFVKIADEAMHGFAQGVKPGAWLVDVLPWLQYVPAWFPGAGWKRQGLEWKKASQSLLNTPFTMTKQNLKNIGGTKNPSMVSQLLEDNTNESGAIRYEDLIAAAAAGLYGGGADTTVSAILTVILATLIFPEVQERAQEEIDRVIGKDRLPTFEDRNSLPYIEGIVCETFRWGPVAPLSPPHRLMADDVYNGYFFPAGCSIIANQWSMLFDEKEYPDPKVFRPERWIRNGGQDTPRHPYKVAFGWGRRSCPGKHLADQSVFIGTASLLATFRIDRALDEKGEPIIPSFEYLSGLISFPKPFKCSIKPRSSEAVVLLRQAIENIK